MAVQEGHYAAAQALLKSEAIDVNSFALGAPPVAVAAHTGNVEIVDLLLAVTSTNIPWAAPPCSSQPATPYPNLPSRLPPVGIILVILIFLLLLLFFFFFPLRLRRRLLRRGGCGGAPGGGGLGPAYGSQRGDGERRDGTGRGERAGPPRCRRRAP